MTLKPGMRVLITQNVISGDSDDLPSYNIKNHTGTIYKRRLYYSGWLVRIDGHPGFITQSGCWIVHEHQMKILREEKNKDYLFLLQKETEEE